MSLSRRQLFAGLAVPAFVHGWGNSPVLTVDVAAPTKDKPQSKLWFAHGSWWAWLPVSGGSSIWRRTAEGWRRETGLDELLAGLPGQADVAVDGDGVRAVLVEPRRLALASLRWDGGRYRVAQTLPFEPGSGETETATIVCETGTDRWWTAYNAARHIWVRTLGPGTAGLSAPVPVSETATSADDICAITALPGEIAVIWSDQAADAVYFRRRRNGSPLDRWELVETVERGGKNADDHFNIAALGDGRLFVASKNSVDSVDQPQHVLRIRDARGRWTNLPYANLTRVHSPTRPIAQLSSDGKRLFLLHTLAIARSRPARSFIAVQSTATNRIVLDGGVTTLIEGEAAINNVTGSKGRLPHGQPWIVLASDSEGRVYEGRLN